MPLSERVLHEINHYIDTYYEDDAFIFRRALEEQEELPSLFEEDGKLFDESFELHKIKLISPKLCMAVPSSRNLEDVVNQATESFSEQVLRLIQEKEQSEVEVYKKANLDRKLFSKLRSNKEYQPKKCTALALAIALELSLDETMDLLMKAGYSLSASSKSDLIIRYFIENQNYDLSIINEALFTYHQPPLGV